MTEQRQCPCCGGSFEPDYAAQTICRACGECSENCKTEENVIIKVKADLDSAIEKSMQHLSARIDTDVKRMLQEDAVVGRWVRLSCPDKFAEFLKRARSEATFRQRAGRGDVFIKRTKGKRK